MWACSKDKQTNFSHLNAEKQLLHPAAEVRPALQHLALIFCPGFSNIYINQMKWDMSHPLTHSHGKTINPVHTWDSLTLLLILLNSFADHTTKTKISRYTAANNVHQPTLQKHPWKTYQSCSTHSSLNYKHDGVSVNHVETIITKARERRTIYINENYGGSGSMFTICLMKHSVWQAVAAGKAMMVDCLSVCSNHFRKESKATECGTVTVRSSLLHIRQKNCTHMSEGLRELHICTRIPTGNRACMCMHDFSEHGPKKLHNDFILTGCACLTVEIPQSVPLVDISWFYLTKLHCLI